jgi:hypothetical protein
MISCLVDRRGRVHAKDGVHSHAAIAVACGVDEDGCLKYEYDLVKRRLVQDWEEAPFEAKQSHDAAAQTFFDECAGDAQRLLAYVKRGNWDGAMLPKLLTNAARAKYDKVCDLAWAEYYKVCDAARAECDKVRDAAWAKRDKYCAAAEAECDEVCDAAWAEYYKVRDAAWEEYHKVCNVAWAECNKACAAALAKYCKVRDAALAECNKACAKGWARLFSNKANRIEGWRR